MSLPKVEIIMGIDPGTNLMGYAFIRTGEKKPRLLQMGVLDMRKEEDHLAKLKVIYHEITRLITLFQPNVVAVEAPFFHKDVQAMLKLGRAQGMAIAAAFSQQVPVVEYLPKVVKKAVTGNGNAAKVQVAGMLKHLIIGEYDDKQNDATDALAVALCHQSHSTYSSPGAKKYSSWASFVSDNPDKLA